MRDDTTPSEVALEPDWTPVDASPLEEIALRLSRAVGALRFGPPVTHVYDPLSYAWEAHREYLRRYGRSEKEVVLVGMNPGPWGMAQTGVPFGEVKMVREWLGIEVPVGRPPREHPKRPVLGFGCRRSEVSGSRLWSWASSRFGTPQRFFDVAFVANYCPLLFLEESGRNRTPDRLPARERDPLLTACDRALRETIEVLSPRHVVGIGRFAEKRARAALEELEVAVAGVLHPSPASPAANREWAKRVVADLAAQGVRL